MGRVTLSRDETLAYIAEGEGFRIVDISDTRNPHQLAVGANNQMGSRELVLSADERYLFTGNGGVSVFDVSNPHNPVLLDTFYEIINHIAPTIDSVTLSPDGKTLFTAQNGKLRILDVSKYAPVPLPNSLALMVLSLVGIGYSIRRRSAANWFKGSGSRGQSIRSGMGHKIEALSVATVGLLGHTTPEHLGGIGDESLVAKWLTAFSCPSQCSQLIVRHGMRKQGSIGTLTISAITPEFRIHIVLGEQGARRAECIAPMA